MNPPESSIQNSQSIASHSNIVSGQNNIAVYGEQGATIILQPHLLETVASPPKTKEAALEVYLTYLISRNRYLQLQGIRFGGRLVHIELDKIYITLRATREHVFSEGGIWLEAEVGFTPSEAYRFINQGKLGEMGATYFKETISISVNQALADYKYLVILGDPGSGKTTLARYLTLVYAQSLSQNPKLLYDKLNLTETGMVPIILYLRQIGAFLEAHLPKNDGLEGCGLLLDFLYQALQADRLTLPPHFFESYLEAGQAVLIFDGLDEVPGKLRQRVARLLEKLRQTYPACRYIVTSRVVGYSGAARLGENFSTTTIRDFRMADVHTFISNWHRLIAIVQLGPGPAAEARAKREATHLYQAIEGNERIRELAINPLLLTVIALVHRDRVKLPDRRAELYAEAIEVLLGKWDEARSVAEESVLGAYPFDSGDKRLMLQALALYMYEHNQKEISLADLQMWLSQQFKTMVEDEREVRRVVARFLQTIQERSGLLIERGQGVYAFSHLTFQEYLAALAVAGRTDYIAYTLKHTTNDWWREVILLQAGHLSGQSRDRTNALIQAIADLKVEAEPYHNLILAAECLRDVGESRAERGLGQTITQTLQNALADRKNKHQMAAAQALAQIGGQQYWTKPYGEPVWIEIPAGEFWMGSEKGDGDEKPLHKLHLDRFWIAQTPISNAQYYLFIEATKHPVPRLWEGDRPPKDEENHPVRVLWQDALAYCQWLGKVTGKSIRIPSEAEWEKAARGWKDKREYPWGEAFEVNHCNSRELGLGQTTPVGIFSNGASPYGCLDMVGNTWEWTRNLWGKDWRKADFKYPYDATDGREIINTKTDIRRVVRGGSCLDFQHFMRCAYRYWVKAIIDFIGFRVIVSPLHPL